ncbi:MAG: MFS transporter, partial [Pseudomonadota bacterium]
MTAAVTAAAFFRENARWLIAGLLLTFCSNVGQTYFIAIFSGEIRGAFDLSHGQFGLFYTVATLASGFTIIWLGQTADFRNFRLVAVICLGLLATVTLGMGINPSAWLLVPLLYGLRLLGQGMMGHLAFTAMGKWFARNRGRAVSTAALGQPIGEAILPAIMVAVIATYGLRASWVTSGLILLVVGVPLLWLLLARERTPQSRVEGGGDDDTFARDRTRAEALRMPTFHILLVCVLAPGFIMTGLFFHQVHIAELKGWSLQLYALGFTAYAVTSVIFMLVSGWAIDRWSAVALLPVALMPLILAILVLLLFSAPAAAIVYLGLAGCSVG